MNARFQEIQASYETLSDPQERAWYDDHRDEILAESTGQELDKNDFIVDLWPYFRTSVYRGYGDDAEGFYAVCDKMFKEIARKEDQPISDEGEWIFVTKIN